ncbi:hypothetical protein WA538_004532 [Blastocystis sp. DL]
MEDCEELLTSFLQLDNTILKESGGLETVESVLSDIVIVFSSYDENQRILFANKFISIVMWDPNHKHFGTLIRDYFEMAYLYGSVSCRKTMLLIMIRIKDCVPNLVTETLSSQVSYVTNSLITPNEKELLLRLFLGSLPAASVIADIQQASISSGISIIRNLRHISVEKLLTDYIQIDHGLLDLENLDILRSAVELIVRIARESSSSYQSEIIEQLLSKVPQEDPQRNRVLLSGIHSILQNASFILSYKEIDQLIRCYTIDDIRDSIAAIIYSSIVPTIDDVKKVADSCLGIDPAKYVFVGELDVGSSGLRVSFTPLC